MAVKIELTPHVLRDLISYNPETGAMKWNVRSADYFANDRECKRWNCRYAETPALAKKRGQYGSGYIMRQMKKAHRVAWAIHYGEWPVGDVDHVNGIRDDNRIINLRIVTRQQNCKNAKRSLSNKSGSTGVLAHKGKWRAFITSDYKSRHLGIFDNIEDAIAARKSAEIDLGFHKNHGRK